MTRAFFIFSLLAILFTSCDQEKTYMPKPRMFPKVEYPVRGYQAFNENYCPLSFEYPNYAIVEQDNYFFDEKPENPCWFTLQIPSLNASLHCSYLDIPNRERFDDLVNDSYEIASKHNIKANYRDELVLQNPQGVHGLMFEISGEVASQLQFYLTDTTSHFFRASLYFNDQVNADSIAPIYDFVRADVMKMVETFRWEGN
jgi:gliding motility-associated lipoprotein GldD